MDGFTKTVQKTAKQTAQAVVKQVAKTVKEEREGFEKVAKAQITGEVSPASNELGIEGLSGGIGFSQLGQPVVENHNKDQAMSSRRIQELRQEINVERGRREEKLQSWRREQETKMEGKKPDETQMVIQLPTSPRRGPVGPGGPGGKGPKGTGEMIKSKK